MTWEAWSFKSDAERVFGGRLRGRARSAGRGAVVAVVLALMVASVPATAQVAEPDYVATIGGPGHAGVYAWGAATARDGSILIGDYWNYTIRRYSPTGELLQDISEKGTGPGQNMAPHGIATDPNDGSIYMADMNHPWQIHKWDSQGRFIRSIDTYVYGVTVPYPYVTRIAVDGDGDVIAVSSHNVPYLFTTILVWDAQGRFKGSWGVPGDQPGQLGLIHGIDIGPDDEVYLADATKGRVQVFAEDGTYLRSFGYQGAGPGGFPGDLRGVRVDADDGWVYVVDAAQSQIEKFDLQGNHLRTWGSEGTGPGQFRDGGRELAIGADNNVYAPDFGNVRVNVYTPDGVFVRDFPSGGQPPDGGFNQAQGLAVDQATGRVFVADTFNHRVQRFGVDGTFQRAWGFRGSTAPAAMNYPRGVAVDPTDGTVWLDNSREGNIKHYTVDGQLLGEFGSWGSGPGQFDLSRGIHVAGNRVYVADSGNHRVQVFDRAGRLQWEAPCGTGAIPGRGPQLLEGCTGLATDAAGNLYAAAVTEHVVYRYAPDGRLLGRIGGLGSGDGELRAPYDVAVHDGLLYVSESNNHRVSILTPDGNFVGSWGSKGDGPGEFVAPRAIDVDASGRVFVMDSQNERIQVFQLADAGPGPDREPPDATVSSPGNRATVSSPVSFEGTATDDVGVAAVRLAVKDRTTGTWLRRDGSWGGFQRLPTVVASPGSPTSSWSLELALPPGAYGFNVQAEDGAGVVDPQLQWRTFDVSG